MRLKKFIALGSICLLGISSSMGLMASTSEPACMVQEAQVNMEVQSAEKNILPGMELFHVEKERDMKMDDNFYEDMSIYTGKSIIDLKNI